MMPLIDTVVRAELAQTKVQIHQMTTALHQGIDALDRALKSVERIAGTLADNGAGSETGTAIDDDLKALREARAGILNMRLLLR